MTTSVSERSIPRAARPSESFEYRNRYLVDSLLNIMLVKMSDDVEEFHRKVVHVDTPPTPRLLSDERQRWAENFLHEELQEFEDAHDKNSLEDAIDALVDLIYVALGRLLEMGVPPLEAFDPVHNANMAKVLGRTHRDSDTDAAKPEGWKPPDHAALVAQLMLRSKVSPALLEATAIVLERGADYNGGSVRREDHFPFGMRSIFQMMWVKVIRMRADIEMGREPKRDHLVDLINYSRFGVDFLDGREMK